MSKQGEALAEAGGELVRVSDADRLIEVLQGKVELETIAVSAEEMQQRILEQLLGQDDVWAEPATWSTKDSVGKVFVVNGITGVYPGKQQREDGSRGVFCCYDVVDTNTGETGIMTSGSARIMARLAAAWKRGEFGDGKSIAVQVVERSKTADGNVILDVEKVEVG